MFEEEANYKKLLSKMEKLIRYYNELANNMYKDLGLNEKDFVSFNRKNREQPVIYSPKGATAFRKKFLMNQFYENTEDFSKLSKSQLILTLINSSTSQECLQEIYKQVSQDALNNKVNFNEYQQVIIQKICDIAGKRVEDFTIRQIEDILNEDNFGFITKKKHGTGYSIRINNKKSDQVQALLRDLQLDIRAEDLNNNSDVKKVISAIRTQLINQNLYQSIAKKYWDEFLLFKYYKIKKQQLSEIERTFFITEFVNVLKKYGEINFDAQKGEQEVLKGFLAEFGLHISAKINGDMITKIVGQNYETRVNKTTEKKKGNLKDTGFDFNKVQSATDIIIESNNHTYKLQVKNSLKQLSDILAFRAQSEIKISSFIPTAIQDKEIQNVLIYLLINEAYLSKAGLGPYQSGGSEDYLLKASKIDVLKYYTIFMLSQAYEFILGSQYRVDNFENIIEGNMAYVYQDRFLIPVAAFLVSAYSLVAFFEDEGDIEKAMKKVPGGLSLPAFTNTRDMSLTENNNISLVNLNRKIQQSKIRTIHDLSTRTQAYNDKVYKYPDNLITLGSHFGEKIYNQLKFKLRITLYLNKLESLMKM